MTSPPSSSSESPSKAPYPSSSLSRFDPFAEHPFTNCSVNQNIPTQQSNHHGYAYPYGPSMASYSVTYNQFPQTSTVTNGPPSSSTPRSSPKPYGYSSNTAIPFRKETASPELGDVLRANKTKAPNSLSSSNLPKHPSQPVPITHPRKY